MAKTLRTSGDYTIKAGAGTAGTNQIDFDSKTVRVRGDLIVDGDQTIVNTATLSVEDTFIELARNNSGAALDAGIYVNRGTAGNNAVFYWDESEDAFKAATTTDGAGVSPLTAATLATVRVAEPVNTSDAATKYYVDNSAAGMSSFSLAGDSGTTQTVADANTVTIAGSTNISTAASTADTITINLKNDLNNITSVTSDASNSNLTLTANGTGSIVINNIITFASTASDPTTGTTTKLYHKTVGGGVSGVYFKNPAGVVGELISKAKATALAIALG